MARGSALPGPRLPFGTFSEVHRLAAPRAKLTTRAITRATDALAHDDTTVAALARHLGVDWHTAWDAIEAEAIRRLADPGRLEEVVTLGVDAHLEAVPPRRGPSGDLDRRSDP